MNNNIVYIVKKKHHWCIDTAAESINATIFETQEVTRFNPLINTALNMLMTPYYALKIPRKSTYCISDFNELLILKIHSIFRKKKPTIIHILFSDYYSKKNHLGIKRKFLNWLANSISGAIVPSPIQKKEIEENGFDLPVEISYHYPKTNELFKLKPDLKSKGVITIGISERARKGTDIFIKIADSFPEIKFYLLGPPHLIPKELHERVNQMKNLITPGYVPPEKYLELSAFTIIPSRYDPGPITLNEAMATGLIPIVSKMVGGKELVKELDEKLIIDSFNSEDYIKKLRELINKDKEEIKNLSKKSKEIAYKYRREIQMKDFKVKFDRILNKIRK
jgi:glycosyltransferase involved in cell wall biosynthesis